MNITFSCSQCDHTTRTEFDSNTETLECGNCKQQIAVPKDAVEGQQVNRCLACPSTELFVRKNFSQKLGVAIIVAGFIASSVTWYLYWIYATFAILFATALIDVLMYFLVGDLLQCYRCHAEYRGVANLEQHPRFSLETHEKYRQQAARLKQNSQTPGAK